MAGAPLFRLNGLRTVWVNAEVPEGAAAEVRPGNAVEARTPALPGSVFKGRVSAILPEVNATTRTLKARIELANPGRRLVPGMFATIDFAATHRKDSVLVPRRSRDPDRQAYRRHRRPGGRALRARRRRDGHRKQRADGDPQGRCAGDSVVVSGQFLIDSEASLACLPPPCVSPKAAPPRPRHTRARARSRRSARAASRLHGPDTPSLMWGPMTMEFKLREPVPEGIAPGANVAFDFAATSHCEFEIDPAPRKPRPGGGRAQGELKIIASLDPLVHRQPLPGPARWSSPPDGGCSRPSRAAGTASCSPCTVPGRSG